MAERVIIKKDGKVIKVDREYNETTKEWEDKEKDVTSTAPCFLFEKCTIEDGVTLKDIFKLLKEHLSFFQVLIGNWCDEIVEEGLNNPEKDWSKEPESEQIEYLELYWDAYRGCCYEDESKTEIYGYIFPSFHGVSPALSEDKKFDWGEVECPKGQRIHWAIEFTPTNELINLPVKLSEEFVVYNDNDTADIKDYNKPILKADKSVYSLGQILYGIIWELSFCGSPGDRAKKKTDLDKAVKSIEDGTAKLAPFEIDKDLKDDE